MHPRQGDDADRPLRPPGCLQEVFREDDTDRRIPEAVAAPMCHLQGKDSSTEGQLFSEIALPNFLETQALS